MPIQINLASIEQGVASRVDQLRERNANGAPVVLTELGGPREEIVLGNKNTPQQDVEVVDQAVVNKVHNPGNPEATLHMQGMEYDDIVLVGRFRDPVDTLTIGGARKRVDLLRAMQHRGNLVRLTWGDNIVRTGVIHRLKITEQMHNRIGYEITFMVSSAGEAGTDLANPPTLSNRQAAMERAARAAEDAMDALLRTYERARIAMRFVNTFRRRQGAEDESAVVLAPLAP